MRLVAPPIVLRSAALAALFLAAACGGPPAPPATPKPAPPVVLPEPEPAPAAPPASAEPAAEPPAPAATDTQPVDTARAPSGRPPVIRTSEEEITDTFGSTPAAKLELGDDKARAVLRIPEYAFDRGVNVTFKLDKKAKNTGGLIGRIYHTLTQVAGASEFRAVTSLGPPFQLEMPAGNKKNANLAIGEILVGENDREKITWHIVAPSKIDDVSGIVYFELPTLGDYYLHVTSKAITPPPAEKK
jgi:hypothetical protein